MAVPFLYAISISLKTYAKQYLYPFLRNEYAIIVQSKTSVKFLFSFAALIFFPPQGLSFWHQPLSCRCKGMAAGFGNKRSSLRFSKKSPHRWVVFFRKTLYFQPRRPWKAPETKRPMRQEDAKKMSEKGATKRWRNENFPSVPGTANNLIQGYMTTNINITQTWWRLLSAVGSTLITLVAWLGYMALCMVGEVILGIVKFIFGIIIAIFSVAVLIGTFIWLLTL